MKEIKIMVDDDVEFVDISRMNSDKMLIDPSRMGYVQSCNIYMSIHKKNTRNTLKDGRYYALSSDADFE